MTRRTALALIFAASLSCASLYAAAAHANPSDPRLAKAFRKPDQNGWIFVHLEGTPSEIGFQHGYLLAPEIEDAHKVIVLGLTHDSRKPYSFFRTAAEKVLWPRVEPQYRDELKGIAEGLKARGVALDLWDVVAMNGWLELVALLHRLVRPSNIRLRPYVAAGARTIAALSSRWAVIRAMERW